MVLIALKQITKARSGSKSITFKIRHVYIFSRMLLEKKRKAFFKQGHMEKKNVLNCVFEYSLRKIKNVNDGKYFIFLIKEKTVVIFNLYRALSLCKFAQIF